MQIALNDIQIRTVLKPGDVGSITQLHGWLYGKEYGYGVAFETYVAQGLYEFYKNYDAQKDAVWICEHKDRIIGFLLLMHRENKVAQLRYFILLPEYRGLGLGKKLLDLFMEFLKEKNYSSAYLWTTNEQVEAASLYTKYGFVPVEEKPSTAFEKELTEQKYILHLDGGNQ
jgi:peptidyl-dipeptidase Dcp